MSQFSRPAEDLSREAQEYIDPGKRRNTSTSAWRT